MNASRTRAERPLTGRAVLAMFVGGFGIIVAVNLTLAWNALRTFPGLETESSYVASQTFDEDRAAQDALGWDVALHQADGLLSLAVTRGGAVVVPEIVEATLGRATHVAEDSVPAFVLRDGAYVAPADLGPGNWNLRVVLRAADGTLFRRRMPLRVAP